MHAKNHKVQTLHCRYHFPCLLCVDFLVWYTNKTTRCKVQLWLKRQLEIKEPMQKKWTLLTGRETFAFVSSCKCGTRRAIGFLSQTTSLRFVFDPLSSKHNDWNLWTPPCPTFSRGGESLPSDPDAFVSGPVRCVAIATQLTAALQITETEENVLFPSESKQGIFGLLHFLQQQVSHQWPVEQLRHASWMRFLVSKGLPTWNIGCRTDHPRVQAGAQWCKLFCRCDHCTLCWTKKCCKLK